MLLGYELEGQWTLSCLENKTFDHPAPVCAPVECSAPPDLEYGFFLAGAEEFLFMSTIKYKCDEGYEMISEGEEYLLTVVCKCVLFFWTTRHFFPKFSNTTSYGLNIYGFF